MLMTWHDFRNKVLKTNKKGAIFKIRNSKGNRDAYNYINANIFPIKDQVTEKQFGRIISAINKYVIGITLKGLCFSFPYKLGQLRIGRAKRRIAFDEHGNLKTNMQIDWNSTLKLWYDYPEEHKNKTLVKTEDSHLYKIVFSKHHMEVKNKDYYNFVPSRTYKSILKEHIRNNDINVFDL